MSSGVLDDLILSRIKALFGPAVSVVNSSVCFGGCINESFVLVLSNGEKVFLKSNSLELENLFSCEATGLRLLSCANSGIRVPEVLDEFKNDKSQFLLLEFVESGVKGYDFFEVLGRELAFFHLNNCADFCGLESDNFIGATRQVNSFCDNWIEFFGKNRLEFQVRLAEKSGLADKTFVADVFRLIDRLDSFIPSISRFSLLHGDFWGGNYMVDSCGRGVFIDPAVYYGHSEADLAMTELFGGFSSYFYSAYNEVLPFSDNYSELKDLYNLYHMLNHLNLFGRSYIGNCRKILRKFV